MKGKGSRESDSCSAQFPALPGTSAAFAWITMQTRCITIDNMLRFDFLNEKITILIYVLFIVSNTVLLSLWLVW